MSRAKRLLCVETLVPSSSDDESVETPLPPRKWHGSAATGKYQLISDEDALLLPVAGISPAEEVQAASSWDAEAWETIPYESDQSDDAHAGAIGFINCVEYATKNRVCAHACILVGQRFPWRSYGWVCNPQVDFNKVVIGARLREQHYITDVRYRDRVGETMMILQMQDWCNRNGFCHLRGPEFLCQRCQRIVPHVQKGTASSEQWLTKEHPYDALCDDCWSGVQEFPKLTCDRCKQKAAVLEEPKTVKTELGDKEYGRYCNTCAIRLALPLVKKNPSPLASPQ